MKVTTIRSWQRQKVWSLQVDFGEVDRHHAISLRPDEDHIDFADRLHELAENIKRDPHLNSNDSNQAEREQSQN